MFGTGSGWRATITQRAEGDDPAEVQARDALFVAHRGYVTEQAARRVTGTGTHVRRQHAWSRHGGIVAVPSSSPNVAGMTAVSYAGLAGPLWPLLNAYACESIDAWHLVEPYLWREIPSRNQKIAGRDAMARIMYREASTAQDARARNLRMRAADYRQETRAAEYVLRGWLIDAACRVNRCGGDTSTPIGASQGAGIRSETWWHPERETVSEPGRNHPLQTA